MPLRPLPHLRRIAAVCARSARRFAANGAIAVAASSAREFLYVRRSELKEISPDAVDVSSFDEAKRVASVAEEERRIIEAERRRLGLDV
jgi:hypothetical protein